MWTVRVVFNYAWPYHKLHMLEKQFCLVTITIATVYHGYRFVMEENMLSWK